MIAAPALIYLMSLSALPAHMIWAPQDPPQSTATMLPSVEVIGATPNGPPDVRVHSTNENPNGPDQRVTCRRERVTGSNRWQRLCTTPRQRQDLRDGGERAMSRLRDNLATPECETAGGCRP